MASLPYHPASEFVVRAILLAANTVREESVGSAVVAPAVLDSVIEDVEVGKARHRHQGAVRADEVDSRGVVG